MEIYHPRDEELLREMRRVRRSDRRKRLLWGLSILLVLSIATGLFVFHRYFELAVMHGPAMGDTIPSDSLVLIRKAEAGKNYASGDIILYSKRIAEPVEIAILNKKGKPRDYCRYILYRDVGTTRQYYSTADGTAAWKTESSTADIFETDLNGTLKMDTEFLSDGEYWLKEVQASYGQDVMEEPIPFNVANPVLTQMKRVLAAPGDRVVLGTGTETRINGQEIDKRHTSGRTADASVSPRRVIAAVGEYFVQGDQLSLSVDSRDAVYDTISEEDLDGQAVFILWPVRSFGSLTAAQEAQAETGQEEEP